MSWIDKLKDIFKEEKIVIENNTIEQLTLQQVQSKVIDKINENNTKEAELKNEIFEKINKFEKEINESIEELNNLDLSERKEYEKVKLVVAENLDLFTSQVNRLIHNLNNSKDLQVKEQLNKIFSLLNEFNRASQMPFEKARILIGKELLAVKLIIKNFIVGLDKDSGRNKQFFDEKELYLKLNSILNEINNNKSLENKINENIEILDKELKNAEEKKVEIEKNISGINSSVEFQEDIKKKEEHKKELNNLESEIQSIKNKIDLKSLIRQYHSDKKKSQLIKEYSGNFKYSLENDSELKIIELLEYNKEINIKELKALKLKISELNKPFITETEKKIQELGDSIRKLDFSKADTKANLEYEISKKKKISVKIEKIILEVKELSHSLFPGIEIKSDD